MLKAKKWFLYGLSGLLLIVAILSGGKTLYHYFIIFMSVLLASHWILRHNIKNLYIQYFTNERSVTVGDSINIDYKITNTSIVPILHTLIEFKMDKKLNADAALKEIAYFRNYDKINFSKDIICKHRGYYKIGQVNVEIYDPLMLEKKAIVYNKEIDITVYPKVVSLKEHVHQSQDLFGTLKSHERTLEDRTNLINIRPYVPGDQIKNIHWKVSAKTDRLHTKEFEQTVNTKSIVLVDGAYDAQMNLEKEETLVSFAVSLVKGLIDRDIKTKIVLNNGYAQQFEAETTKDFQMVLEMFTAFESSSDVEFAHFMKMQMEEFRTDHGMLNEAIVILTQSLSPSVLELLQNNQQNIHLYTFDPKTVELRECYERLADNKVKIHYIDQLMDVAYENK